MKLYFVSDDAFFLQGAERIVSGMENISSETIQVNTPQFIKYFNDNDVIFLAINSGMVKEFIINNQTIKKCHLILIYNHPITFSAHGAYPWVMPKKYYLLRACQCYSSGQDGSASQKGDCQAQSV